MDNEKKNQFSEIINDINSTDLNKLEEHQKTLVHLLEKTKQAIELVKDVNPNQLVAAHMKSGNIRSAEWFELDRKQKTKPIVPDQLLKELESICQNEKTNMLSCILLGLGSGYWVEHLNAFEQIHTVDMFPHWPELLEKRFQPQFLTHLKHTTLDPNFAYTNLDSIPNTEVGFVFSWDFLPYFTIPQIEKFFQQINNKLIKGGRGCIHFSNADNKGDLELIKQGYYQYCDQKTITELLFDCTNFDIEQINTEVDQCSYLRFKKPGEVDWKKQAWWRYHLIRERDPHVNIDPPEEDENN